MKQRSPGRQEERGNFDLHAQIVYSPQPTKLKNAGSKELKTLLPLTSIPFDRTLIKDGGFMTQNLVVIENNIPVTTSRIVAEQLGIEHRSMMQLIKDHQAKIEKHFGLLRFQNAKIEGRGRPEQHVELTENQAHYILTLSRNTEEAMEVKALFVKAFDEAKRQLFARQNEMLALAGQLTHLETRLHALPPGLSSTQIDLADVVTTRIRQTLYEIRKRGEEASRKHKITPEQMQELLGLLHKLYKPMSQLRDVIQQDLDLETDLTFILFDYRGVLETVSPEYKLLTEAKPRIKKMSRSQEA